MGRDLRLRGDEQQMHGRGRGRIAAHVHHRGVAEVRRVDGAEGVAIDRREERRRAIAEASVAALPDGRFAFKFDPRWFGVPSRALPPLGRVTCPTLVVRGSESTLLSAEGAREYAAQIPGAELLVVKGAGHHVHLDQPEVVRAALEGFLARVSPPD